MQQGTLKRNGESSSEYTWRAWIDMFQRLEKKRMNGLIEDMN